MGPRDQLPSNTINIQKQRIGRLARTSRPDKTLEEVPDPKSLNLPGNSIRARVRKKTFLQRVSETFLGENPNDVGKYVLVDVLIPAAKKTIQEMINTAIDMALYGGVSQSRGRSARDREYTSYRSYYNDPGRYDRREPYSREISRMPGFHDRLDGISFERPVDAEMVLEGLEDQLKEYGAVSIGNFYDTANISSMALPSDYNWGWTNLDTARILRTQAGWEITFPRVRELR